MSDNILLFILEEPDHAVSQVFNVSSLHVRHRHRM